MNALGLGLLLLPSLVAQNAPTGWKEGHPAPGIVEFTPSDLKGSEVFRVAVFPLADPKGQPIAEWTKAQAGKDPLGAGERTGEPVVANAAAQGAVVTQTFKAADGRTVHGLYTGLSVGGKARLVRLLMSEEAGLYARYKAPVEALLRSLQGAPAADGATNGGGAKGGAGTVGANPVYAKLLPKLLAPCRMGGPIKEGIYEGPRLYSDGDKNTDLRIYLFSSGEYLLMTKDEDDGKFHEPRYGGDGDVVYNEATGKLNISGSYDLMNDKFDPDDEHTLYLTEPSGKPFIYGRSDRGTRYLTTILEYKGPVERPSPRQAEFRQKELEAAAKRYKWVTAPGKGLTPAQIETVWHDSKVSTDGLGGAVSQDSVYILLKDGTIYDGLPVAPDQFDAPTSRRREPEKWGKWRRQGGKLLVTWRDSGGRYAPLAGGPVRPGSPGQKLSGRYGAGEAHVTVGSSSWTLWGVTFSGNRFLKDRRGGAGNSQFMVNGGMPAINTVYDDDGSVTSAVGDGFVVATDRKVSNRRTRTGVYTISGYTITLKYDDGRVIRHPFFLDRDGTPGIWFEAAYLTLDDKKK